MAKHNPLFVDSTLLRGDSIGTQIELSDVVVLEGEAIYLVLLNEDNEETCMALNQIGDTSYDVFVRLVHQRPVTFYFGIAKDGELLFRSQDYQRIASYALLETWIPKEIPVESKKAATAPPLTEKSRVPLAGIDAAELSEDTMSFIDDFLAEVPGDNKNESLPSEVKSAGSSTMANTGPVLVVDEVLNITQLFAKWGFN